MFDKLRYFLIKGDLKKHIKGGQRSKIVRSKIAPSHNIDDKYNILKTQSKSFSTTLLNLIDQKNVTDVDCYKRANVDRKLFSKIRSNQDYKPSKNTVLAFAVALKLNVQEINMLLASAGYSLSNSFITDLVVKYFIEKKKYDINIINIALEDYKQQPLGSF